MTGHVTIKDKVFLVLKPSLIELLILCFGVGIMWIFSVIEFRQSQDQLLVQSLDTILRFAGYALSWISNFIDSSILALNVVWALMWALFGVVVYIALWAIMISLRETNDTFAVAFRYIHPVWYDSAKYWGAILVEKIIFGLAAVASVFYAVLIVRSLADITIPTYFAVADNAGVQNVLLALGYTTLLVTLLHGEVILLRILLIHRFLQAQIRMMQGGV